MSDDTNQIMSLHNNPSKSGWVFSLKTANFNLMVVQDEKLKDIESHRDAASRSFRESYLPWVDFDILNRISKYNKYKFV